MIPHPRLVFGREITSTKEEVISHLEKYSSSLISIRLPQPKTPLSQALKDFRRERVIFNDIPFIPDKADSDRNISFAMTLSEYFDRIQRTFPAEVDGGLRKVERSNSISQFQYDFDNKIPDVDKAQQYTSASEFEKHQNEAMQSHQAKDELVDMKMKEIFNDSEWDDTGLSLSMNVLSTESSDSSDAGSNDNVNHNYHSSDDDVSIDKLSSPQKKSNKRIPKLELQNYTSAQLILQRACRTSGGADSFFMIRKLFEVDNTLVTQRSNIVGFTPFINGEPPVVINTLIRPVSDDKDELVCMIRLCNSFALYDLETVDMISGDESEDPPSWLEIETVINDTCNLTTGEQNRILHIQVYCPELNTYYPPLEMLRNDKVSWGKNKTQHLCNAFVHSLPSLSSKLTEEDEEDEEG